MARNMSHKTTHVLSRHEFCVPLDLTSTYALFILKLQRCSVQKSPGEENENQCRFKNNGKRNDDPST